MKRYLTVLFVLFGGASLQAQEATRAMLIVVSEPGEARYETEFKRQAEVWKALAARGKFQTEVIGMDEPAADEDRVKLERSISETSKTGGDFWLVWIGHGSFDDRTANFNLRGKDVSAAELREWLKPFERRLILLNLFSASGPFLTELAGPERVIVSANRSAGERNYSRFGEAMADALTAADADMDRDGSLSLLEASLFASASVRAFYADAQRVVQEHAVIDDNGDGVATPLENFKGFQANEAADGPTAREIFFMTAPVDPLTPEARRKRKEIEAAIDLLRKKKAELPEDQYYQDLEVVLRQMARLYAEGK